MPQPINLEAIEVIDAIERRGSFAAAAEELERATSAVSYTVQKLEEQLGVTLFQRQGRRSVLTPAGQLLINEGRRLLEASSILTDQVRELSSGWEPRLRIALDSTTDSEWFFKRVAEFLKDHDGIEIDVSECVLNGGWESLEQDRVELVVGAPGPAPQHKGLRTQAMETADMVLVAAADHAITKLLDDPARLEDAVGKTRRVISHDTAQINIVRNAGLLNNEKTFFVQTVGQKLDAQLAGIGIGHLPRSLAQKHIDSGALIDLTQDTNIPNSQPQANFIAWKISNKGKGLKALVKVLSS